MKGEPITAAQAILLAAHDLAGAGKIEFTEWDLSVSAWKRDRNRFGLRGYEDQFPDHKRVMTEIMGQSKKDNAVRRGWIEKAGTNRYRTTPFGMSEAQRILNRTDADEGRVKNRSPRHIYESILPYISHKVFADHTANSSEPQTWLGAAAFLSLTQNTGNALDDKFRVIRSAIAEALAWMDEAGSDTLQRGPVGGGRTIRRIDLQKMKEFLSIIEERFAVQISSIRKKS